MDTVKRHSKKEYVIPALLAGGTILLFLIPLFVFGQEEGLVPCDGSDCDFGALIELGQRIINWLLTIAALIGAVMFAYAGVRYITAGGNEEQIKSATSIFKTVFFGIIIALAAWLVVELLVSTLLKEDFSPLSEIYFLSTEVV